MKQIYFLLLILGAFASCNQRPSGETESSKLMREFKPMIQGVWNNQKDQGRVLDSLKKAQEENRQPNISGVDSLCISTMDIETDKIFEDELWVDIGWCNRKEGSNLKLTFTPGKHTNSIKLGDDYELAYHAENGDTTLTVYCITKGNNNVYQFNKILRSFPKVNF